LSGKNRKVLKTLGSADWAYLAKGVIEYNVLSHFKPLTPKVMTAVVNYRCNARCQMCNIWQSPRRHEMSVDEFAKAVADPLFDEIERLTVVGGEVTLRTDLVDLTRMFVERMPKLRALSTISNGFLPDRIVSNTEAMLALTEPRGIGFSISISLDGLGTDHDKVRGVDGAFEKVLTTLDGLQKLQQGHKFWMGVGYTVMHQNLRQAHEFQKWADQRDIEVGFTPVGFHNSYVSNLDLQSAVDYREEDRDDLIAFMQGLSKRRSLTDLSACFWSDMVRMYRDGTPRTTPCPYNMDGLALDCYGDLYYCLSTPKIGNCLNGQSASEIYYDPKNLQYRAETLRGKICKECNSACAINVGLKKDLKNYLRFIIAG
jgi:MoaA/NifB/PqqE/SkfB family radical SAM enzyme